MDLPKAASSYMGNAPNRSWGKPFEAANFAILIAQYSPATGRDSHRMIECTVG